DRKSRVNRSAGKLKILYSVSRSALDLWENETSLSIRTTSDLLAGGGVPKSYMDRNIVHF
ncbi:MAG TPA: hypothetical protein VJ044_20260, partial [Candidatus Hodarchaeales archaeon]|nr:hypothetical protein [Candidatus Hodarchaeales archaeon]